MTKPPLLGDSQGRYMVHIIGNSGTGKSTTGIALAQILGVPYISLDELFWEPGWTQTSEARFKEKILAAMAQSDKGWVADGNYHKRAGFITDLCTDLIWLDPPFIQYFPRIFIRTMLRLVGLRPPCSPGCGESLRGVFFSKDSILWWCISQHWVLRARCRALISEIAVTSEVGNPAQKMRRLGGWGGEHRAWMQSVVDMCRAK